jgi:hypothetical protein
LISITRVPHPSRKFDDPKKEQDKHQVVPDAAHLTIEGTQSALRRSVGAAKQLDLI